MSRAGDGCSRPIHPGIVCPTCGGERKMWRGVTGLKCTVLALSALTTGNHPANAGSANTFAQVTAHLLDCDVPGGSVRFTPFGDDGVTMNLNLPAASLADTPFAGESIVTSISSPGKSFLRFGVYASGLMAMAEALLKSPAAGGLSRHGQQRCGQHHRCQRRP
jgi:hypothetical protein